MGFGKVDFITREAIWSIYFLNPDTLMFDTDLPSTRVKRPFKLEDIELISDSLEEEQTNKVLYRNVLN